MPDSGRAAPTRRQEDLCYLSIREAAKLLRQKKISPVELVGAALARIEALNPGLNAFLAVTADRARRSARAAEREIARGRWRGPLHGIPISLKDNIWTRAIPTTAGSRILAGFLPGTDSEVAKRLAEAGAILVGKTNLHEFAYGVTSDNPHFGPVRNPWNRERIPGGSSGGSAAAVASGMGLASVGTDTGGSIRIPSALCGVVGFKPTFGGVSVSGIVPLAETLDHAGPIARSVADASIMLQAMATDYPARGIPDYRNLDRLRLKRVRLGWPRHYFFDRIDREVGELVERAARLFGSLGARLQTIPMPRLAAALLPATNDIALAEATNYHISQHYFPGRAVDYGEDVRRRLEAGAKVLAVDYLAGLARKSEAVGEFERAFERVDAIIAPTTAAAAPRIGQREIDIDGTPETVRSALVRMNRPANFTGHPAISIPCGFTREGLPVGMQLIGPRWSEPRLFSIAAAYESATEWHSGRPPLAFLPAG